MHPSAIRSSRHVAVLTFVATSIVLLCASRTAQARSAGINSAEFANVSMGCNNCHTNVSGTAVPPDVSLMVSTSSLTSGQQITLTFVVTSKQPLVQTAAGFNIRSSQQGIFAVGGSAATGTRTITNTSSLWLEATHSTPKGNDSANQATFTTLWTPSAGTTGTVTFTAWGNSVNLANGNQGDRAAMTTMDVTVTALCTPVTWYHDVDGDGYGNNADTTSSCTQPPGYVSNNTDCNDGSGAIHPGAAEICNGIDDNCAGGVDDGLPTSTFYFDGDHDGYGNPASTKVACNLAQAGAGYVTNNTDCNDASGDVHPGAIEACNGVDDDCNGTPDNGLAMGTFYRDADADGYGDAAATKVACSLAVAGAGYVGDHTDCNDADKNIFPGAPEICGNGKDDNCNGVVDADAPANSTFYKDADGDGYGSATSGTTTACAPPAGYVSNDTDCNDGDPAIHPGATEICNGKDDNCANGADEGLGTISCGEGPCRTTVDACAGGVTQVCTPMCPDAGSDAETRDASTSDTGVAADAGPRDVGALDIANPIDVGSAADARSDTSSADAPSETSTPPADVSAPPDARADAASRDSGTEVVVEDAASMPGANEGIEGSTDSGCSCRTVSTTASGSRWAWGVATLVLLGLVRRRRSALGKRRGV